MREASLVCGPNALSVGVADSFLTRGRGLLARAPLAPGHGLLIRPCRSVHTWFMREALDLVGLTKSQDGEAEVTWIAQRVRPWRFRFAAKRTHQIVELPAGEVARIGLAVGSRVRLSE